MIFLMVMTFLRLIDNLLWTLSIAFLIVDTKKFVEDMLALQMEIFDNSSKQKIEKKKQMLIDDDKKREGAYSENRLMKQV